MEKDMKNIEIMEKENSLSGIREIKENIRRVKLGLPLTKSLIKLNNSCEFRKEWEEKFNKVHEKELKEERLEFQRRKRKEYYQNNIKKYMIWQKRYHQSEMGKKKRREWENENKDKIKKSHTKYRKTKKYKEWLKNYLQKPEVKEEARNYIRDKNNIPKERWRV